MKSNSCIHILLPLLAMLGVGRTGFAEPSVTDLHPPATSIPSRAGVGIPDGYHLEKQTRKELAYLGAFSFGVSYMLSVVGVVSFVAEGSAVNPSFQPFWLLVPVAGPFALLPSSKNANDFAALFALGAAEVVGVALIISSIVCPRMVLVRNRSTRVVLAPMRIGAAGNGIGLMSSF
jgi:hypothetical protein